MSCWPQVIHPIHDQTLYLNERHKKQLKEEFSKYNLFSVRLLYKDAILACDPFKLFSDVEPWTFEQHLGEAVFIPAGCPHQVRNRQVRCLL